jgi:hypothetical protein
MAMNKNKAVLLAKLQTAAHTDPTPAAATDALLVSDCSLEYVSEQLKRNNIKPFMGANKFVTVGTALKISFTTELAGSGMAGTAPRIGCLFRACNFAETVTAVTSVSYDPHSNPTFDEDAEALCIYFYQDGRLHKLLDCRGSGPDIELKAGQYGKMKWEFTGIFAGPTDAALVSPTFSTVIPPRFLSAAFALDSYAAIFETLTIKCANEVAKRMSANSATGILEYFIKEREFTAEYDPEAVLSATKDWFAAWTGGTLMALTTQIGATAGNICTITAPQAQLSSLKDGDRDNILTQATGITLIPTDDGDDEIKFLFT